MAEILDKIYTVVWGVPALVLILGVGIYLSIRTSFAQVRFFPRAIRLFFRRLFGKRECGGGVSPFQALCTALAATVGTGNLAGVAGALAIGGPGAIFWMWICGILGMVTKFAEAVLSVRYREKHGGEFYGGPMYVMRKGLGRRWAWLGAVYSFFGAVAAFGVGNATQINAVITGINDCILAVGGTPDYLGNLIMGAILALLIFLLLSGGAGRIGKVTELLVPIAAVSYLLLGTVVLILRANALPSAFRAILSGAFSPQGVTGGLVGSFMTTLRIGVSRGVFTNEAGMGTAGIAHAGASVAHPVEQGLLGAIEVFLDTIVICTMTALVILCSGVPVPYGSDAGLSLTADSFSAVTGDWVKFFIAASVCLFAFATVLGWGLYGIRCAQYLFGNYATKGFIILQSGVALFTAVADTETVWLLAETINGLMTIPNLITLAALTPELRCLIIDYERKTGTLAGGGTLCKFPLTQTAVNPRLCENSTPLRWQPKSRGRRFTT